MAIAQLIRGYDAFNEGDSAVLLDMLRPDFVYRPRAELPGNEPAIGREQFARVLRDLWDTFPTVQFEVQEDLIEDGDVILATIHQIARGRSSGLTLDTRVTHVWRIRNGMASELSVYTTREQALEAAGITE